MRFTKEVKAYRLQKRFVKTVNSEIVSMGFPNGSLQDVLKGRDFMRVNDKLLSFRVETAFTTAEFEGNSIRCIQAFTGRLLFTEL